MISRDIKKLVTFLLLVFILPLLLLGINAQVSNVAIEYLLYGIEAATPSIAAIIVVFIYSKQSGLKTFFSNIFLTAFKKRIIILAVAIPLLVMLLAKVIYIFFFGMPFSINVPSAINLLVIVWALFSEEIGWRGFLQPLLQRYIPFFITPLIVGVVWALWHYHFFISGRIEVPIILFLLGCIFESYIYIYLVKWANGNIIPAMIYHCLGNLFINSFLLTPDMNGGNSTPYLIMTMTQFLCVVVFIVYDKLGRKSKHK